MPDAGEWQLYRPPAGSGTSPPTSARSAAGSHVVGVVLVLNAKRVEYALHKRFQLGLALRRCHSRDDLVGALGPAGIQVQKTVAAALMHDHGVVKLFTGSDDRVVQQARRIVAQQSEQLRTHFVKNTRDHR